VPSGGASYPRDSIGLRDVGEQIFAALEKTPTLSSKVGNALS